MKKVGKFFQMACQVRKKVIYLNDHPSSPLHRAKLNISQYEIGGKGVNLPSGLDWCKFESRQGQKAPIPNNICFVVIIPWPFIQCSSHDASNICNYLFDQGEKH